ncbi:MAG: enoyl-CoA hydratase/isomerase family protein, partial [Rhodobacteraceae bacterium]|nr:enoyl-CoA hydratase/isomerase family protein [Paracoccaceae bacterium]
MTDIRIRKEGRAGRITLDRPQALNALTHAMALGIDAALDAWRDDPEVAVALIDATGARAFCAGGDLQEIYAAGRRGDFDYPRRFWAEEYRMNATIARYPKPYVALMQGYVMGGGVGVASHGSHRVVGDTSRIAMPECGIGLIPDVGGTLLLAQAPGRLGEYLGLSGHRMGPGEAIAAGFADHYVPEADWPALAERLVAAGDPAEIAAFERPAPGSALQALQPEIDDAFSAPDLETLMARLAASDWGAGVRATLARQSPLSMACTLELVRMARAEPGVEAALAREFRFTARSLAD